MFHCFTFFLVIRFCILRLSLNTPALHLLFHGVPPQAEEKFYQPFVWDNMVGSPPHRRGKEGLAQQIVSFLGITPAQAGKSKLALCTPSCPTDHPRVGGEKSRCGTFALQIPGSPPRRRGKGPQAQALEVAVRITPAQAGKSLHSKA